MITAMLPQPYVVQGVAIVKNLKERVLAAKSSPSQQHYLPTDTEETVAELRLFWRRTFESNLQCMQYQFTNIGCLRCLTCKPVYLIISMPKFPYPRSPINTQA